MIVGARPAVAGAPAEEAATEGEPEQDSERGVGVEAEAEAEGEPSEPDVSEHESEATEPEPEPEPEPPIEPSPAVEPEPEPEPEPSPPASFGTRVRLVGGAPGELELFRLDPTAESEAVGRFDGIPYTRVCTDPCELRVRLHADDELFVAGRKLMPSRSFRIDPAATRVTLRVRPGPKALRFAGFGLTVGGAILVPGGGLLVGAIDRGRGPDIAGYTLIAVGAVSLAIGIALIVRGRTVVQVDAS
jgi:hypothetical protein